MQLTRIVVLCVFNAVECKSPDVVLNNIGGGVKPFKQLAAEHAEYTYGEHGCKTAGA